MRKAPLAILSIFMLSAASGQETVTLPANREVRIEDGSGGISAQGMEARV